jgi:putative sigma-54 modulation protein
MTVKFSVKDAEIGEKILQTMENKLHLRLDKYFRNQKGEEAAVTVKITEKKPVFTVELTLPYGGYQLRAETSDKNGPLAALDSGMDTMERQIAKYKDRISGKGRVQRAAPVSAGAQPAGSEDEEPHDEEYKVVKIKIYEMKPMSIQEAILQMEFLGHSFYVFSNLENAKVCTVYRRNDGNYGLIEPAD